MLLSDRPQSFPIPFAANAGGAFIRNIPVNSQIGTQDGAASLNDGFVPDNFTQIAAGGVPPFGQDMNGILQQATAWCRWFEAGGVIRWDSAFAASLSGGYPTGAIVTSNIVLGNRWLSVVDVNTADPDSLTQTTWCQDPGSIATGTPVPWFSSTVPPGYTPANGNTIGALGSNANTPSTTMQLLYRFVWFNFSNSICPVLTSGGVPTTRGANPDADFAALKQLTLPDMRGIGLRGVDTMGGAATTRLSGVPISVGNTTTPGSGVGENLHTLVTAELAVHTHANTLTDPTHSHSYTTNSGIHQDGNTTNDAMVNPTTSTTGASATGITINNANAGSGSAHNNVALDRLVYWNLKL